MTLEAAINLIGHKRLDNTQPQVWADLGCGDGLFSRALLKLLHPQTVVHAIDKKPRSFSEANIIFHLADFEKSPLPVSGVNGIIMANALHYVQDQLIFLQSLKTHILPGGLFVLVEYDTDRRNPWVPYPVSFAAALGLFQEAGFGSFDKINQTSSLYRLSGIYSAIATA